jgi:NAD(P)-dependent dehydrogenase (short-subunit alcohol dehydrogenase family)
MAPPKPAELGRSKVAPLAATPFALDGRVAVVTGGLGLIGRELCEGLLEAGANVVVADIDGDACRRRAEELAFRFHRSVRGFRVDVTDPGSVTALREAATAHGAAIDVLVNSAAVNDVFDEGQAAQQSRFENYPLAQWQRALDVNLTGTFLTCQILGAEMARRGSGSIINIASTYGLVAPDQRIYQRPDGTQAFWKSAAYPASKGGVIAFSRFLASYWAAQGVRVNVLSPGGVQDGQEEHFVQNYSARTPLGRMAGPHEYRAPVVFLAGSGSSYMTGANLVVDGGWTTW